jgi:hypothetical protein
MATIKMNLPAELGRFRFPKSLNRRLHDLLDKQDRGELLTSAEKEEAEGLVEVAEMISLLKLRIEVTGRKANASKPLSQSKLAKANHHQTSRLRKA